jgi:ubiquinone/menaquinone biosynthesis C-methylase UbiE
MLKIANNKLGEEVALRLGDSEDLTFYDDNFDIIIYVNYFHHYNHQKMF